MEDSGDSDDDPEYHLSECEESSEDNSSDDEGFEIPKNLGTKKVVVKGRIRQHNKSTEKDLFEFRSEPDECCDTDTVDDSPVPESKEDCGMSI